MQYGYSTFIFNSTSNYGVCCKKEMEKIPLLGYWMKERGCVFIDREDVRLSLKAINQAIENLKLGHSMAVFPEGT